MVFNDFCFRVLNSLFLSSLACRSTITNPFSSKASTMWPWPRVNQAEVASSKCPPPIRIVVWMHWSTIRSPVPVIINNNHFRRRLRSLHSTRCPTLCSAPRMVISVWTRRRARFAWIARSILRGRRSTIWPFWPLIEVSFPLNGEGRIWISRCCLVAVVVLLIWFHLHPSP